MSHDVRLKTSIVTVSGKSYSPGDLYKCASASEAADMVTAGLATAATVEKAVAPAPVEKAAVEIHHEKPHKKMHTRGK